MKLMVGQDWHWFRYPFLWEGDTLEKRHAVRAYLKQNRLSDRAGLDGF